MRAAIGCMPPLPRLGKGSGPPRRPRASATTDSTPSATTIRGATQPRTFRDVPDEERRRLLQVIDGYYAFIDGELEDATARMRPDDLLVVVSGFGMQPLDQIKQTIARLLGDPLFTGTHERAPDGFMLAYGASVQPGRRPRGSVVDVAPTLLYLFLGHRRSRGTHGRIRTRPRIFFTRAFTAERPIVFIPTYSR